MCAVVLTGLVVTVSTVACSSGGDIESNAGPTDMLADVVPGWSEEEVSFPFGAETMHGVVTLPIGAGPHPAFVLVSGSGDETGVRAGTSAPLYTDHARGLAEEGFVALRYDPPGVGRSTGDPGLPSFAGRIDETLAALEFLGCTDCAWGWITVGASASVRRRSRSGLTREPADGLGSSSP